MEGIHPAKSTWQPPQYIGRKDQIANQMEMPPKMNNSQLWSRSNLWDGKAQAERSWSCATTSRTISCRLRGSCSLGQNCFSKALTSATGRAESWSLTFCQLEQLEGSLRSCFTPFSWKIFDSATMTRQVFGVRGSAELVLSVRGSLGELALCPGAALSASTAARTSARNLSISAWRRNSSNSFFSSAERVPELPSDRRGSLLLFLSRFCFLAFLSLGDELEEDEDEDFFFERFFFFFPVTASSTSISSLSKRPCKPLRSWLPCQPP